MGVEVRNVLQTIESSLEFLLSRIEIEGSEDLNINFKVKIVGSQKMEFLDTIRTNLLTSEPNGRLKIDKIRCDCCRKYFKNTASLIFEFNETSDMTCKKCGPVRRSNRTKSQTVFKDSHHHPVAAKGSPEKDSENENMNLTEKQFAETENVEILDDETSLQDQEEISSKNFLTCELCNEVVCDDTSFTDHLMKHSGIDLCKCAVCGCKFINKYVLKKHMKQHIPQDKRHFKCTVCDKGFTESFHYKAHTKTHCQTEDFKCSNCYKTYSSLTALKRHSQVHRVKDETSADPKTQNENKITAILKEKVISDSVRPFQCVTCGKSFFCQQAMEKHSSKHIPRDQWKHECKVCNKKFSHKSYLQDHQSIHKQTVHECEHCGKKFTFKRSHQRHVLSHQPGKHSCCECGAKFLYHHQLKEHLLTHNNVPLTCKVCGKGFKSRQILKRHARTHLQVKPFSCKKCTKQFYNKYELSIHMRVHSGERPYQCDVCGRMYTTKSALQYHSVTHKEDYNVVKPCPVCAKEFTGSRALNRHLLIHQTEKNFVCELCGKRFLSKKALWSHNQTHIGYKPHECKYCLKKFRSLNHCKNHMKIHTGENLIQCENCKVWFTDANYVKKVHPKFCKEIQVSCDVCGREFSHNNALQSHLGFHTGERPFQCEICGRAFAREGALTDHSRRHVEAKSHICKTCGNRFNLAADLKRHEERHSKQIGVGLPWSLKAEDAEQQEKALQPVVTGSGSDSRIFLSLGASDTVLEEVHRVADLNHLQEENVVLATIDPAVLEADEDVQYCVSEKDIRELQEGKLIQYQLSGKPLEGVETDQTVVFAVVTEAIGN